MSSTRKQIFMDGFKAAVDRTNSRPSEWVEKNFKMPKDSRKSWSFKDHEWQIDVINCDANHICMIKPAQVGASTLAVVEEGAFCAQHDKVKAAHVMPTAGMAAEFTSSRIDPLLDDSPYFQTALSPDVDSQKLKKINNSFWYIRGTTGTAAISVDLDFLARDEVDFCDQEILSTYSSRLQHSDWELQRDFSTPTVPEWGIAGIYEGSSQGVRMVRCGHCSEWVYPRVLKDLIIPGVPKGVLDLDATSVKSGLTDVDNAYIQCPSCKKDLWESLCNPDKREWVHASPDNPIKGFRVGFFDVPKYNPVPKVLKRIEKYKRAQDFVNFVLGYEHEDKENQFSMGAIKRNTTVTPLKPEDAVPQGNTLFGIDLGKVTYVAIGKPGPGGLDIVYLLKLTITPENPTVAQVVDLIQKYGLHRLISDALPQYEVAMGLSLKYPSRAFGAYYATSDTKLPGGLDIYSFKDHEAVVNISRTYHFNDLCRDVNFGLVRFPKMGNFIMQEVAPHFKAMKKITNPYKDGTTYWTNTGPDHWAHAVGYLYAAYKSIYDRPVTPTPVTPATLAKKANMKT